jgi:hypothetical protein
LGVPADGVGSRAAVGFVVKELASIRDHLATIVQDRPALA